MLDDQNWRWLTRYLANECSEQEKQSIEKWIATDPGIEKEITHLKRIWDASSEKKQHWDIGKAWERLIDEDERLHSKKPSGNIYSLSTEVRPVLLSSPTRTSDRAYKWATLAVAVAAAIVITFLFYTPSNSPGVAPKPSMQVVSAHMGERIHLTLSDGTKILLNADSKLKIPHHFADSARNVYLQGEAYFEVAHHKNKPFVVHAGKTVTQDLSTRFIVSAYPESKHAKIIVTEGKVAMRKNSPVPSNVKSEGAIITPHHIGFLRNDGSVRVMQVQNLMEWVGWTKGKLVFNNTPFSEVMPQLERWYDLNITIKDQRIATKRLTATYVDRQPMKEVLDAIALSLDIKYTVKNRSVVMYD